MIIVFIIIELLLFFTNFSPNTYLTGWDNMMPEFSLATNLLRGIFGVWQEYRGLGLTDGMSHAANTLHTLYVGLLSLVLPQQLVRYTFIFFTHLVGGIGVYVLLLDILPESLKNNRRIAAAIGALFFMFNFATIQMFYTPFEAFSIHFAAIPWLVWSLHKAMTERSRRYLLLFFALALATTPQFFVPTMILPTVIVLAAVWLISNNKRFGLIALAGFLLINAFWLAPYLSNLPKNAPVIVNAKINQMSSLENYQRNQAFGNAWDVLTLRGFPLDFQDYADDGSAVFLMQPWRTFLASPFVLAIDGIFALIALLGAVHAVKLKGLGRTFVLLFVMGFILLGTNVPVIREMFDFVRKNLPVAGEALRFPFTKFSILFAFAYSVLVAYGILWLMTKKRFVGYIAGILLFISAAPAFAGGFIAPTMRVAISENYKSFFTYMQSRDPNERILVLPQQTYWSWKLYKEGYRGSGFMWFGVPQALMDRAFDPWSTANENAYWELSYALYKKDANMFSAVLSKYTISGIVLDGHQTTYGNYRSLFLDETKTMLQTLPEVTPTKTFGKISFYSLSTKQQMVYMANDLPVVTPPYQWTDNDVAYRELGDYITKSTINNQQSTTYIYPFRSLFTKRSVNEREFTISKNDKEIIVSSLVEPADISIPEAVSRMYNSDDTNDLNAKNVKPCGLLQTGSSATKNLQENSQEILRLTATNQRTCLSFDIQNLEHKIGYLVAVESRNIHGRPLMFSLANDTAKHTEIETYLPTGNNWQTTYFVLPPLASDGLGYNVYISNDSLADVETINDIRSIRIYKLPYEEMVNMKTESGMTPLRQACLPARQDFAGQAIKVEHPNPAYYTISMTSESGSPIRSEMTNTLVLSQSFDNGWIAWSEGKFLPHVRVNNWANGWTLDQSAINNQQSTIFIFYWPQLLEWIGFALLPIPFLLTSVKKHL